MKRGDRVTYTISEHVTTEMASGRKILNPTETWHGVLSTIGGDKRRPTAAVRFDEQGLQVIPVDLLRPA